MAICVECGRRFFSPWWNPPTRWKGRVYCGVCEARVTREEILPATDGWKPDRKSDLFDRMPWLDLRDIREERRVEQRMNQDG